MAESDKTTALKKAYAEIILNTAKESAARVMVSDRKSARFQHDLSGTKEEALRLLVRLKHMIDAKTIEADITSSNQQRQIDVLEAQLQEAEDIITDLRSEVRWVRDKLEKAKAYESQEQNVVNKEEETNSVQNVDPVVVVECLNPDQEVAGTCFYVKNDSLPDSLHDVACGNEKHFEGLSVDTLKGNDVCESESGVDIIIEKLELSRNGCTQRVHALERKTMERTSSSSANEEERPTTEKDSLENLSSGKANGHEAAIVGNKRCLVLALRASSAEVITIPSNSLGIKKTSKSRKLRGRKKKRCGKRKASSITSQSQLIKPCQSQSNVPCSKTSNSDGEDIMETHLSIERKEVDALSTVVSASGKAANGATDKDLTSRKKDVLVSCEGEEESMVPSTKMASNLANRATDKDLTSRKVTAVVSDQITESPGANVNRLLKYTFQRKRKRGSSNVHDDSNNLPGKREVKEKENSKQDPIESTLSK